jgi:hypothetical protein
MGHVAQGSRASKSKTVMPAKYGARRHRAKELWGAIRYRTNVLKMAASTEAYSTTRKETVTGVELQISLFPKMKTGTKMPDVTIATICTVFAFTALTEVYKAIPCRQCNWVLGSFERSQFEHG